MAIVIISANITNTWCAWTHRPIFTIFRRLRNPPQTYFSTYAASSSVLNYIEEDCGDFLPWLEQKAGMEISSGLRIGKSACGRSLYASKSVQAGDCMLRVPYRVQLAPENLPPEIYSLIGRGVSNIAKVALLLLYEQKLGQKSEWAPYINRLPQPSEMHNTIFWTENELAMIRQSSVYKETIKQRSHIKKEFFSIKPVLDRFPKFFEGVTLGDFRHAHALVASRAWESSRGVSMIPFADFLNHDAMSEACVLSDEGKQFSEVIADHDYAPGDQVQIKYGKFSNGTLLLDFGFTLPYNIYDQVQVELSIPHHDDLRPMKLELLQRYRPPTVKGVNESRSSENLFTIKEVKYANRKGRGIPQSFRAFARVLCSNSPQELSELEMEAASNDGRLARCPLKNKSREIEAHHLMLLKVTQLIKKYEASIESLGQQPISDYMIRNYHLRRQMAHDLLTGELRVLKSASAWLMNYCTSFAER